MEGKVGLVVTHTEPVGKLRRDSTGPTCADWWPGLPERHARTRSTRMSASGCMSACTNSYGTDGSMSLWGLTHTHLRDR